MTLGRSASTAGGEDRGSDGDERGLVPAQPKRVWRELDFRAPVPEALSSPAIVWVRHDEVDGDPFNIRERLPNVQRLCWSIYQHGLLENLLVVEHPSPEAREKGQRYQLRAGSRRFEAVRRLIDGIDAPPGSVDRAHGVRWVWPRDRPLPCLVLGSEGHYEHLIENIERCPPKPWEVGRRLSEALGSGVSSRELGTRLGRSNGWVTRYAHIGRGLSPELVALMEKEHTELKLGELAALASIRDPYGDPDAEAQMEAYRLRRGQRRRRPHRIDPHSFRATVKRLQYLRADMPIPPLLRPIVTAVLAYLEGGGRPGFRELEQELFDKVRSSVPSADDGEESE